MKNILHLFKRDVQNVSRSVIGMVVVMGLIIVPCLYAWFNIAGSWDPYGNTGNLKIAVVNTDEGYESDLIPVEVNVGGKRNRHPARQRELRLGRPQRPR